MTETVETLDDTVQDIKELADQLKAQMIRAGYKVDEDDQDEL